MQISLRARCVALLMAPLSASAAIVTANFTGGEGTDSADQYPGVAGEGWAGPWSVASGVTLTPSTSVTDTNPLNGGGNYLTASSTQASTGANGLAVRRAFNGVDPSQPHRIQFKYRFDGDTSDFTANFNDRVHFYGDENPGNGTGTTNAWIIGVVGGDRTENDVHQGNWYFFDNNGSGAGSFDTSNMYNTGLSLVAGRVYSFTVDVDPVAGSYAATIDDGVNPAVSQGNLGFRNGLTNTSPDVVHFGYNVSSASDDFTFAVDSVVITPEPASVGMLLFGGAGLLTRRRHRKLR